MSDWWRSQRKGDVMQMNPQAPKLGDVFVLDGRLTMKITKVSNEGVDYKVPLRNGTDLRCHCPSLDTWRGFSFRLKGIR